MKDIFITNILIKSVRHLKDLKIPLSSTHQQVQLYDIQGIVMIDEIETHLHIELQKKILPFLTNFFPKIQFVVTTQS